MKTFLVILPSLIAPVIIVSMFLIANNWATITNCMEEKTSFCNAIEAFKKGATIYRVGGYSRYGSEIRTSNGTTRTVYGTFEKDGEIRCALYFSEQDVMSDEWVIKWMDKGEK